MFELLIENTDSILIFDMNHLYFDENTDKEELLDSIRNMVYAQLGEKGLTNEDFKIKASGLVRSFVSDKVSIVFFNKNHAALFRENIYYETGPNPQCNGNIGSVIWQVNGSSPGQRRYSYQYDGKKQLLSAEYAVREGGSWANSPENGRYDMKGNNSNAGLITYDDNGNILTTLRNGQQTLDAGQGGGPSYGTIDDLVYSYKGNQLDAVTDLENSSSPASMPDFHQKSDSSSGHYGYDANGNLIRDDNKGITSIVYNHLNLPSEINFGTSCKISYIYDATGRKLSKLTDNKVTQHVTDYCGAFVYENNALVMVQAPEGRLMKTTEGYDCQYYLKDHLGNVNVVFHEDRNTKLATIVQEDQFYPYGMKHGGMSYSSDLENKNLYQGKELQNNAIDLNDDGITDSYLDWYDFDARYFDPQLCRWHVPDPANQHASPYLAMSNNPVSFVDPDGLTDGNHYEQPMLCGPNSEGRASWGRQGVEDSDGSGGKLLNEGLVFDQIFSCSMESATRAMMGAMDANLAVFENRAANFELWAIAVLNDQYKNDVNQNAREKEEAPATPNTGGSDEIDPEAELAQTIENSSHTGLSYAQGQGGGQQAGIDGGEHLIGPALIAAGQPWIYKGSALAKSIFPRSAVVFGASEYTSLASLLLRKLSTSLGVSFLGGTVAKFVPVIGWGWTFYDAVNYTVGWDRVLTPAKTDQWVPNRAVFPDGTTNYVCFRAGTQILVKEGFKTIEQIRFGDSVYSYNLDKNTIELSKVVKSFERKTNEIYELTTTNQNIYVTAEHPFYVNGKGWVKVKELQIGFELKTNTNTKEGIVSIKSHQRQETVYNINVEGNHNYFATGSGILVHNK